MEFEDANHNRTQQQCEDVKIRQTTRKCNDMKMQRQDNARCTQDYRAMEKKTPLCVYVGL